MQHLSIPFLSYSTIDIILKFVLLTQHSKYNCNWKKYKETFDQHFEI